MASSSEAWLITLAVLIPVIVLAFCYYILVYYQHPEDRNTAYLPKFVVVSGLALGICTVLMVPFDVANQGEQFGCGYFSNSCGGLDLLWLWQILFLIIALYIAVFIPCTIFFYESFDYENDTSCKACWSASFAQVIFTIFMLAVFVLCFFFLRFTEMPVENFQITSFLNCSTFAKDTATCSDIEFTTAGSVPSVATSSGAYIKMGTPLLVFLPGFLGFIGWFLFSLYVGIGLAALPIDMFRSFIYRPQYMPKDLYERSKLDIQKRTGELMDAGEKLKEEAAAKGPDSKKTMGDRLNIAKIRREREEKRLFNEFKQSVIELEEDYGDLKMCHENWRSYNPIIPWCKLIAGILAVVISLLWIIHIIVYNLARSPYGPDGIPALYFLNTMFNAASKEISFTLIGTILVGVFTFYLLFAVMKGNEKFGLRFFIIEIHPMKYNGTYMNSFLVNTSLILFCVPPLVQFVSASLSEYIVVTDLDAMFGQQITFLTFFRWFYENNVFVIIMLVCAVLTAFIMIVFPNDKTMKQNKSLAKKIALLKEQAAADERKSKMKSPISQRSEQNNDDDDGGDDAGAGQGAGIDPITGSSYTALHSSASQQQRSKYDATETATSITTI